jgi:hypothetical protein
MERKGTAGTTNSPGGEITKARESAGKAQESKKHEQDDVHTGNVHI